MRVPSEYYKEADQCKESNILGINIHAQCFKVAVPKLNYDRRI